ncbi:MAG: hypothetical protein OCD01_08595 [Fibrobacterales bacterium]
MRNSNHVLIMLLLFFMYCNGISAPENLALNQPVIVSSVYNATYSKENAVDGVISGESRWLSAAEAESWITIALDSITVLGGIHFYSGYEGRDPVNDFRVEFASNGSWTAIPSAVVTGNTSLGVSVAFDATVEVRTDTLRIIISKTPSEITRVHEISVWELSDIGIPKLGTGVTGYQSSDPVVVPVIYINQSGYNLNKPKRFTAPTLPDGTSFSIKAVHSDDILYTGVINNNLGDFTSFNPINLIENIEYVIVADSITSFPFRIEAWWLERVSYQNSIDFMIDSRMWVGTFTEDPGGQNFGWRDDHHFGWELHVLVPQYVSNPDAYLRMPSQITYVPPTHSSLWGSLTAYTEDAPDIVKLIHWGADILVTQQRTHENLKAQLAYFLYAWPQLKQWLPEQNYQTVLDFTLSVWENSGADQSYMYDESPEHNLLALKTKMGTTKGALPPGRTVIPNLLMYAVAEREGIADAEKYFTAAFNQVEWMIQNLDWNDPITTKGQRVSEFHTMTGLSMMLKEYPAKAPTGLKEKITAWAQTAINRSDNMWDFRKLNDTEGWVPTGDVPTAWNEPGNVVGTPACMLAAMQVISDSTLHKRLTQLVYAHLDNAFGRNPTGRHFSYDAPREIEGVDVGWYSFYQGGIGRLADARFVFDGAPKNEHYSYNPEVGNIGWSEGWIQHNLPFNLTLAYLAHFDTEFSVKQKQDSMVIRAKAPLNFDYSAVEQMTVQITAKNGEITQVILHEESVHSEYFTNTTSVPEDTVTLSYGYGYMKKELMVDPFSIAVVNSESSGEIVLRSSSSVFAEEGNSFGASSNAMSSSSAPVTPIAVNNTRYTSAGQWMVVRSTSAQIRLPEGARHGILYSIYGQKLFEGRVTDAVLTVPVHVRTGSVVVRYY